MQTGSQRVKKKVCSTYYVGLVIGLIRVAVAALVFIAVRGQFYRFWPFLPIPLLLQPFVSAGIYGLLIEV